SWWISEAPAHRVQISDDIYEPLRTPQTFGGDAAQVVVVCVKPGAGCVVVAAYQGVEAAVGAQQQQRQLALLAGRVDPAALIQARDGGLAGTGYQSQFALPETQQFCCGHHR